MNAVDTNILVYSVDADEAEKRPLAVQLIERLLQPPEETVVVWQVASELLATLRRWEREDKISRTRTRTTMENLINTFPIVLPTKSIIYTALDLSDRHSLSHWDSMLLAACIEAGVQTLYSEDLSHDTHYGTVRVVNPFL